MPSFLIYRHGSNAANQSMTLVMAVAIIEADSEELAMKEANSVVNCYGNQFLSCVAEDELDEQDLQAWNDLQDSYAQGFQYA